MNEDEKHDRVPEVWEGHNIADYIDPDIMKVSLCSGSVFPDPDLNKTTSGTRDCLVNSTAVSTKLYLSVKLRNICTDHVYWSGCCVQSRDEDYFHDCVRLLNISISSLTETGGAGEGGGAEGASRGVRLGWRERGRGDAGDPSSGQTDPREEAAHGRGVKRERHTRASHAQNHHQGEGRPDSRSPCRNYRWRKAERNFIISYFSNLWSNTWEMFEVCIEPQQGLFIFCNTSLLLT